MRDSSRFRAGRGDARQCTDAPRGAPTPEPLGLVPGDLGGPRGPVARGRRERGGARARASRDKKKQCAQSTICVTTIGRVQARSRVDSADPRRELSARWHSQGATPGPSRVPGLKCHRGADWSKDSDATISFTSTIPNTSPLATQVRRCPIGLVLFFVQRPPISV